MAGKKHMYEVIDSKSPEYRKCFWSNSNTIFTHIIERGCNREYNHTEFDHAQTIAHYLPVEYDVKSGNNYFTIKLYDKNRYAHKLNETDWQKTLSIHPGLSKFSKYLREARTTYVVFCIPPKIFHENIDIFNKLYGKKIESYYATDAEEWVYKFTGYSTIDNQVSRYQKTMVLNGIPSKNELTKRKDVSNKFQCAMTILESINLSDEQIDELNKFMIKHGYFIEKY